MSKSKVTLVHRMAARLGSLAPHDSLLEEYDKMLADGEFETRDLNTIEFMGALLAVTASVCAVVLTIAYVI